ncbi:MAG: DUF3305 domain-containing protein [Betaproteobacteria bacterium]
MARVPLASRWATERWQPAAVEVATPVAGMPRARDVIPGTGACETMDGSGDRWRCSGFEIELHPTEAEGYFLNLSAPDPRIFVMWRAFEDSGMPPARPVLVTVSYNEAGRFMDGGEQVDGVPMLPSIAQWMRTFIDVHYRPEPKRKARRNDPFADALAERKPDA